MFFRFFAEVGEPPFVPAFLGGQGLFFRGKRRFILKTSNGVDGFCF